MDSGIIHKNIHLAVLLFYLPGQFFVCTSFCYIMNNICGLISKLFTGTFQNMGSASGDNYLSGSRFNKCPGNTESQSASATCYDGNFICKKKNRLTHY